MSPYFSLLEFRLYKNELKPLFFSIKLSQHTILTYLYIKKAFSLLHILKL